MAAKRDNPSGPRWQVILEDIQSNVRITMEHLDVTRVSLEQRIDRLDHDLGARVTNLEMAFGELSRKFDAMVVPLEARVTAIEKRLD